MSQEGNVGDGADRDHEERLGSMSVNEEDARDRAGDEISRISGGHGDGTRQEGQERPDKNVGRPNVELRLLCQPEDEDRQASCGKEERPVVHSRQDARERRQGRRHEGRLQDDRREEVGVRRGSNEAQRVEEDRLSGGVDVEERRTGMVEPEPRIVSEQLAEMLRAIDLEGVRGEV